MRANDDNEVTLSRVIQKLKVESECGTEATDVQALPLKDIKTEPVAFQPRNVEYAYLASDSHIKTLTEAIKESQDHTLDPLVIWWSGERWLVIDGHHRLKAYQAVAREWPEKAPDLIPVQVFVITQPPCQG